MSAFTSIQSLQCSRCGRHHDPYTVQNLCAYCQSGPLLARYDYEAAAQTLTRDALRSRPSTIWRYHELLPVASPDNVLSMGEGCTPLVPLPRIASELGLGDLMVKDEGLGPTGTFKGRGASVSVSKLVEWGVEAIGMPTAGNAGGAFGCYGARGGIDVHIAMPRTAPPSTWKQATVAGARVYLIDGPFDQSLAFMTQAIDRYGWYNASTFREPWRVEGKKTMGFELFEQLQGELPDVLIYPTGGGVGIIAIHKAFQELEALGMLAPGWQCRLVAVQTRGCYRLKNALDAGELDTKPWEGPIDTVVPGMAGPRYTLGDHLVLDAIRETGGDVAVVDDDDIMAAMRDLARREGVFVCPEGASTLAAARRLRESGALGADDSVVLLNTGSGLKYPEFVGEEGVVGDQEAWALLE